MAVFGALQKYFRYLSSPLVGVCGRFNSFQVPYGWPADLSEDEILARVVALNLERTREEERGTVRWLRPSYQISRFGSAKAKAGLDLEGGGLRVAVAAKGPKPMFPPDDIAQTVSVMAVLAGAPEALDATSIAVGFKQGRKVLAKVTSVLTALVRLGYMDTKDGGKTFALRRAAQRTQQRIVIRARMAERA